MPRIPIIKAKDFLKILIKYGCEEINIRSSHHKIFYPKTNRTSIVSIHGSYDLEKGAFASTLNQLDIDIEDFLKFIEKS